MSTVSSLWSRCTEVDDEGWDTIGQRPGQEQIRSVSTKAAEKRRALSTSFQIAGKSNLHNYRNPDFYYPNIPQLTKFSKCGHDEFVMKNCPLRVEPEVLSSACHCPPLAKSHTPPYLKWAQSLSNLLNDRAGVELFRRYLQTEERSELLDFWFACKGFKTLDDANKIRVLASIVFRKFIRPQNSIFLTSQTRECIEERLYSTSDAGVDNSIFDAAQREVEHYTSKLVYPKFLNSDIYLNYVQSMLNIPL